MGIALAAIFDTNRDNFRRWGLDDLRNIHTDRADQQQDRNDGKYELFRGFQDGGLSFLFFVCVANRYPIILASYAYVVNY